MMFLPYYGEFLVSPIPVELSMGSCSHACRYCFSRANNYKGWDGYASFVGQLSRILNGKKNDLASVLIRHGFPVLISNRSDPFALSNAKDAIPALRLLAKNKIPVAIQTKGGPGSIQAAEFMPPSVWYISISFTDEEKRKKFEPGAPTLDERFQLIDVLRKNGHEVVVGINPCIESWIGNYEKLLDNISSIGVHGIWVERLHMNAQQSKTLTATSLEILGADLPDAAKRQSSQRVFDFLNVVRASAENKGLSNFTLRQSQPSNFWAPFRQKYEKTFFTNQDFVNWCHENKEDGDTCSFDEWFSVVGKNLPTEILALDSVIYSTARNLHKNKIPRYMTYRDLLKIIWANPQHSRCPANYDCFSFELSEDLGEDGRPFLVVDDDDMPFMLFNRDGWHEYYVQPSTLKKERR